MAKDIKKVVLAYSGGLDTSIILKWIKEYHGENRMEGDHVFASFAISF